MRPGANPDEPVPPAQVILPEESRDPNATEILLNALMAEGLTILRDAGAALPIVPLPSGGARPVCEPFGIVDAGGRQTRRHGRAPEDG